MTMTARGAEQVFPFLDIGIFLLDLRVHWLPSACTTPYPATGLKGER